MTRNAKPAVAKAARAATTDSETAPATGKPVPDNHVQPFRFGSDTAATSTALPALDRMNEKLARRLRSIFEGLSRSKIKLAPNVTTVERYDAWQNAQPDYLSLSIFNFLSPAAPAMLAIDASLIMRLVDACYGGAGVAVRTGPREFTPAEEHFARRLIAAIATVLNDSWNEVVPANFQLKSIETNQAFAVIARRDEQVAIVSFDIDFAGVDCPPVQIIYPLASLRQVERELALGTREDTVATDGIWRLRLRQALGEVRVSARTVLARPQMRMAELLQLKPGDIIPVNIAPHVPLILGDRQLALGVVGDHNGIAAIRVDRISK